MPPTHDCHQADTIATLRDEIYDGHKNRQPLLTRVDRVERVAVFAVYISTALLVSTMVAAGALITRAVIYSEAGTRPHVATFTP